MVVDDSVVVRGSLRQIIEQESDLEIVATAMDGKAALQQYKNYRPDVVLMDIEMPIMNGIECLTEILKINKNACVIMCSSLTQAGAKLTFQALELGAFDYLTKPSTTSIDRGDNFKNKLIKLLRGIKKESKLSFLPDDNAQDKSENYKKFKLEEFKLKEFPDSFCGSAPQVLAIGSSTGGPKALIEVISNISQTIDIPIFITQHMPPRFTKILAESLAQHSKMHVEEAQNDMLVKRGHVYVAPGGQHMEVEKRKAGIHTILTDTPPVNYCKPSVDVMMRSLLATYQSGILAVILTGMGDDGLKACGEIVDASNKNILIAQDETTSVVWGMPGAVARADLCHGVIPMSNIAPAINKLLKGQRL